MKLIVSLLVVIFLVACSSPKETVKKPAAPKVSKEDLLRGGYSFNNAVVIMVNTEADGLNEEYKWLSANYPGYGMLRKTHVKKDGKEFDIIRIKTKSGSIKDVYFDSTRFWGKN